MAERSNDYHVVQKVLHWLMAILIMLDLVVAQKFGDVLENWDRLESRADHASLGSIVLVLFVLRLFFRYRYGAPALPTSMPAWQVRLANGAHLLLYVLIGCLITTGILTAMNATAPLQLFQTFEITLGNRDESFFQFVRQFHEWTTISLITLIGIHILAALYHLFIARDGITTRMLIFWRRGQ